MELKIVIISISCLYCLAAPVMSASILETKYDVISAVKGAAVNGTKTLVTGGASLLADTAAAAITAKGTLLKDLLAAKLNAIFAAKGAVVGGAIKAEGALINKIIDLILGPNVPVTQPHTEKPQTEKPHTQKPHTEKPHLIVNITKPHKPCRPSQPSSNQIVLEVRPQVQQADYVDARISSTFGGLHRADSEVVGTLVDTYPSNVRRPIVYDFIRTPPVYAAQPYINIVGPRK